MEFTLQDIPFTAVLESDIPDDFFHLFLSDDLLQHIVDQSNLYAEQCLQTVDPDLASCRIGAWKSITLKELKTFLGLLFLTGVIVKHEFRLYWSTDEVIAIPYFSKTMVHNRFQLILRFIHFRNITEATDSRVRLFKVKPVLNCLVNKFKELYQPNVNISIDGRYFIIYRQT